MEEDTENYQPGYLVLLVPLAMVISTPVRFFIKKFNSVLPQNLFMGIFGAMIGGVIIFKNGSHFVGLSKIPPDCILSTFLPIYIVPILYRIDFNIFKRCLPQALLIVILEVIVSLLILGCIFKFILQSRWSFTISFLAALSCIPIQPCNVILMFKELAKYKYLGTILEAEAVLTCIPVFIIFDIMLKNANGKVLTWYVVIMMIAWSSLGGIILGCVLGKITAMMMCWIYNEPQGSLCVFIGATFFTFYLSNYIARVSGSLAVVCLVCFIVNEKHRFSTEVDICIDSFWQNLSYISENIAALIIMCDLFKYIWLYAELRDLYDIVIIYFCSNIVRLIFFQVIGFIINRMAYNINIRCLLVLGWSGIKGNINMICVLMLIYDKQSNDSTMDLPLELTAYIFLTLMINSTSMRITLHLTGLSELSSTRRTNMNNCMKFILEKRSFVIDMLRLNRYLSDANWAIVRSETIMQHPYKIKITDEGGSDDDDEEALWNASSAICPECFKEVPFDLSEKELLEIMKEAMIKIIKAKKVSIIKQFETGIINRNSLEILIHIFEIMIESNQEDNVVDLSGYMKESKFIVFITKILNKLDRRKMVVPPTGNEFNRLCYYIIMHIAYDYVVFAFTITYCAGQAYMLYMMMIDIYYLVTIIVLNFIFIFDFLIKIVGYGRYMRKGFMNYIRDGWNLFDFLMLIFGLLDVMLTLIPPVYSIPSLPYSLKAVCLLRCFKIFYLIQPMYPKIQRAIELRADSNSSAGYDLATALVNCCDEILDLILQIIEISKIRETYTHKIHKERHNLVKLMDRVQKVRPWVAITMKTKQVIRITLTSMEEALNQLKFSGFVDNIEYSFIYKEIFEKQRFLRNLKYVEPSPPKMIFNEVPWMAGDETILEYLYNNVQTTRWDVGDVICKDGKKPSGILIVVTGLLKLSYHPKASTMERYQKIGHLPILDYLASLNIDKEYEDTITSGNTIGELCLLTGRPYDCDIIAETPGQAYVLTTDIMRTAIKLKVDPVAGLEAKLWKHATFNMAIAVLMESFAYQSYTHDQIKLKLGRAFIPNLRCYKLFIVTDMMEDVILMEGVVADYNSSDIFIAPMLIPKSVQKLVFPRNGPFEMGNQETILLILPTEENKEREIMLNEEDLAELVSLPSSTCLLHTARAQQKKTKTKRRVGKKGVNFNVTPGTGFDIEANVRATMDQYVTAAKNRENARIQTKQKTHRE